MDFISKRVVLDSHPLFLRARPVLLHLFGKGLQSVDAKWILIASLVSIAILPFTFAIAAISKLVHVTILTATWWLLRGYIEDYGSLQYLVLALGFGAIFYKSIYDLVIELLFHLLVLISFGEFLRWLGRGYLPNAPFRQKMLMSDRWETLIAPLASSIPHENRKKYDELMDLLLNINQAGYEDKLLQLLSEYEELGLPSEDDKTVGASLSGGAEGL